MHVFIFLHTRKTRICGFDKEPISLSKHNGFRRSLSDHEPDEKDKEKMARRPSYERRPTQKERRDIVEQAPTVRDVIEAFGGVKDVADTVGIAHPSVCQWVRENRIPPGRVSELARHYRVTRTALSRFVALR